MTARWRRVDEILHFGLENGVYTAAVLLAGTQGEVAYEQALGRLSAAVDSPKVTPDAVFDLASLTKPFATALALLTLIQDQRLSLKAELGEVVPTGWLPPDKRRLSLTSLLAHNAGLPAWRPFYQTLLKAPAAERPGLLERLAAAEPLDHPPGRTMVYSDLGFIILKAVVEAVAAEDMDAYCRRRLYRPLGLTTVGFNPLKQPGGDRLTYPATETGLIPGRRIQGEVHDENAWAAGGLAGHAGLFGTGREVFRLAVEIYYAYHDKNSPFFSFDLVRAFLTPPPGSERALGFDLPAVQEASCGRCFSPRSVGHLGFTGVSCWIDLELGQIVVLLTNRVHLGRDNAMIRSFRPRLHEATSRALGFFQIYRT
ncbi:serine hydrolase domain-containing protein [Desulfobacca acetoxidans]|uniref:Beta-lactamase n=1 Tax=Desulfobacca acetoxidans (strain ATCC 700848 / DSM 11109 / ASRB2) TaxID=880072 RepID=F2NFY0_DESAR|nr:serine hydrolase [Desulfobacca acetoxidans]AEB08393.1 beta-lactamase [Desulfobacca acetoxidans DSM 11109]